MLPQSRAHEALPVVLVVSSIRPFVHGVLFPESALNRQVQEDEHIDDSASISQSHSTGRLIMMKIVYQAA